MYYVFGNLAYCMHDVQCATVLQVYVGTLSVDPVTCLSTIQATNVVDGVDNCNVGSLIFVGDTFLTSHRPFRHALFLLDNEYIQQLVYM